MNSQVDGEAFPLTLSTGRAELEFYGGGARTLFGLTVYTVGVYMPVGCLSEHSEHSGETLAGSARFFEDIVGADFDRVLLLIFKRMVPTALASSSLASTIAKHLDAESVALCKRALDLSFAGGVSAGLRLYLTCAADGDLRVAVGKLDNCVATVPTAARGVRPAPAYTGRATACEPGAHSLGTYLAFLMQVVAVYLGEVPISKQAKRAVADGFAEHSDRLARCPRVCGENGVSREF